MRVRVLAALLALVVGVALGGCVRLPDAGDVTVPDDVPDDVGSAAVDYVPPGPAPGETPDEIVQHFLGAMRATSLQTSVARSFLTESAAEAWAPEQRTIVYEDASRPTSGTTVSVDLQGAASLDDRGQWVRDPGGGGDRSVTFGMEQEDGEWRIATLPNALIVPLTWLEARFERADLYFLDPSARILVPTPVFVPSGEQLAARLANALFEGPPDTLAGVVGTSLGTAGPGIAVDVSSSGLASVRITSGEGQPPEALTEPMVAQLAWTLRQVPSIVRIRVLVDDVALRVPDGGTEFAVGAGQRYTPDVAGADASLYGLVGDQVVEVDGPDTQPVAGAERLLGAGVRRLSVDLYGTRLAAQVADGSVVVVPLDDPAAPTTRIEAQGTALMAWDFAGRLWIADGGDAARLRVVSSGTVTPVSAPELSGRRVTSIVVSRDGSRLAAVVGPDSAQQVVVARVRYDERGGVADVVQPAHELPVATPGVAVLDVGWRSATELLVLARLDENLVQLQRVPVDGSPGADDDATLVMSDAQRLVSSTAPGTALLLVGPETVEEYEGSRLVASEVAAAGLTYPG
ncbi:MAG TPA: GerMN domain-containing protein [Nocardioides sp.]